MISDTQRYVCGSTGGIYSLGMKVTDSTTKERAFSWAMRDDRNLPDGKRWEGVSKQSKQQKENNRGEKVSHTFREQCEARRMRRGVCW